MGFRRFDDEWIETKEKNVAIRLGALIDYSILTEDKLIKITKDFTEMYQHIDYKTLWENLSDITFDYLSTIYADFENLHVEYIKDNSSGYTGEVDVYDYTNWLCTLMIKIGE